MASRNIVFHVTKKYMKLNRRRTVISFIGVVFMVLLMTCVYAGKRTVLEYMESIASLDKGKWHFIAYDMTPDEVSKIKDLEEIESIGLSSPLGSLDFLQTSDKEKKPFIDVKEYSPESFDMLNIQLTEGRLPENEHELIISASAVEDGSDIKCGDRISGEFFDRTITGISPGVTSMFPFDGIEIGYGETVTVPAGFMPYSEGASYREDKAFNGNKGDYTVVGIMAAPTFESSAGASYAALCGMNGTDAHGKAEINLIARVDTVKVEDMMEFKDKLEMLLGRDVSMDINDILLMFSASSADASINSVVFFIEVFFTVFIMAASVILIYNVFNMSYAERTRYLGMLSSVGATRKQKRQSIFYECFSLLIPALPVGILLGCGVVKGGMQLLKPRLDTFIANVQMGLEKGMPVHLSIRLGDLCIIAALCTFTVLLSALIPAIKISKIGPVESIRGAAETTKKKRRFKTRKSLLEKGRPEMLLAVNSTARSKHLTKGIVRSVCVFAVLTMVTLYGADSIVKVAETLSEDSGWNTEYEGYDYILYVDKNSDNYSELIKRIDNESSVLETKELITLSSDIFLNKSIMSDEFYAAYKEMFFRFRDNTEEEWEEMSDFLSDQVFEVICVDDEEYKILASKGDSDMNVANDASIPSALIYNTMFFSPDRYRMGEESEGYKYIQIDELTKLDVGDKFEVMNYNSKKNEDVSIGLTLAGKLDESSVKGRLKICADCPYMIINRSALGKITEATDDLHIGSYMLLDTDSEKDSRFAKELFEISETSRTNGTGEVAVLEYENRNVGANIKQVLTEIVKILAYCFTALISVVCLLNLYNSIRGRAAERTKETAVLRSVGMTDRQLTKMHDLENLMIFGKGICIAAVICAVLSAVLRYFIVRFFGNVELPLPLILSLCIAGLIFAASSIMTRICSRSSGKTDIIEKIRRETV